ncbi:uncharacterized protein LOC121075087 isoform X2 [Cygnus olor]|uniref:uncharacterized protein LOC121075087 isoform X2 n=1 Tax=Cygnus olor TaxID=8869 RepID=UPI001ADEAEFF|nr:uncharacterized protein LOC121075087 isoform X2 [Cygnus olor]
MGGDKKQGVRAARGEGGGTRVDVLAGVGHLEQPVSTRAGPGRPRRSSAGSAEPCRAAEGSSQEQRTLARCHQGPSVNLSPAPPFPVQSHTGATWKGRRGRERKLPQRLAQLLEGAGGSQAASRSGCGFPGCERRPRTGCSQLKAAGRSGQLQKLSVLAGVLGALLRNTSTHQPAKATSGNKKPQTHPKTVGAAGLAAGSSPAPDPGARTGSCSSDAEMLREFTPGDGWRTALGAAHDGGAPEPRASSPPAEAGHASPRFLSWPPAAVAQGSIATHPAHRWISEAAVLWRGNRLVHEDSTACPACLPPRAPCSLRDLAEHHVRILLWCLSL